MNTSWANETHISNEDDINTAVYLSFLILLFILGLCGNSLTLLAVKYEPQLRRYSYAFTVNSAVSDCAVLILADVFIITGIATDGNYLKQIPILCDLSSFLFVGVHLFDLEPCSRKLSFLRTCMSSITIPQDLQSQCGIRYHYLLMDWKSVGCSSNFVGLGWTHLQILLGILHSRSPNIK